MNRSFECKKRLCDRSSCMRRQKIHRGGEPHKCPSCGKSFSRQRVLTLHQNTHAEESPKPTVA
ncbi:Hypothetical predicted protein [Lynx pardinus]|uniref:C2H2-type domain-containing protein n=1 Tax=Lynx pardinus TaxID=191816 RepID=A0A485NSL8_LYNPA|nr:Hypothetical predicted protein [Lynx pardinus]